MKNVMLLIVAILVLSCKNKTATAIDYSEEKLNVTTSIYPENISKIFDAHGGVDVWKKMQTLVFTMEKPNGNEITTTDLKNRKSLIEMPKHTIGFNGKVVWLKHKDTTQYKGNAKFYYNLMFYFYAMPFILADDGIIYEDTDPLIFEGQTYPGIKISYQTGVGESPEDEYLLYYNKDTYQMEWLGYTVTYFSKQKESEFHFIKYSNWQTVENLVLPKTLTWYKYDNNKPTEKRDDLQFTDIKLLKTKLKSAVFNAPEGATLIQ